MSSTAKFQKLKIRIPKGSLLITPTEVGRMVKSLNWWLDNGPRIGIKHEHLLQAVTTTERLIGEVNGIKLVIR